MPVVVQVLAENKSVTTLQNGSNMLSKKCDHYMPVVMQVLAENHINVPGLSLTFTDPDTLSLSPESKSALSLVPYKPAAEVAFGAWDTPLATPAGQLGNAVPGDRLGVRRAAANDLPGAFDVTARNTLQVHMSVIVITRTRVALNSSRC
jgi:hypothetical protein